VAPLTEGPYVLSDRLWDGPQAAVGPGAGTAVLSKLVPERFEGAALDVGCGCGALALAAAQRGARRAVGVDVNARAVALARFNAALNGFAADFLEGDLLAPVRGERFDLILAQPPFVAHPRLSSIVPRSWRYSGRRTALLPSGIRPLPRWPSTWA